MVQSGHIYKIDSCPWNRFMYAKVKSILKGLYKMWKSLKTERNSCTDGVRFRELPPYPIADSR